MRKRFVFIVLIPLIILGVVVTLFIHQWVEAGLEAAGEAAVGARVEIDGCRVSLFPIGLRWSRLQVTDPRDTWHNLFETGKVAVTLDAGQLLRGKYIIETAEVKDVILGTRRTTDGAIPHPAPSPGAEGGESFADRARETLNETVSQSPVFNLDALRSGFKPDSLVAALDLRTLRAVDSLRAQVVATSRQWDAAAADFDASRQRLLEAGNAVRAIDPQQLNSIDRITSAIGTADKAVSAVREVSQTFSTRKASIEGDVRRVTGLSGGLDDVVAGDFARLKGMARLPELSTVGIARLLVGKEMVNRALLYLRYADVARSTIRRYTPAPAKEEHPPRMKGQTIHFPVPRAYPKFWMRKAVVSGGTDTSSYADLVRVRGEVRDVTNDQSVTGVPMTVDLEGTVNRARAMTLHATFDRTREVPYDEYRATLTGVPLAAFEIGKPDFLPGKVVQARMNTALTIAVPGASFDATARFAVQGATLEFASEPRTLAERLAREVLAPIHAFGVDLRLWTTAAGFDVALATDLDDLIAARVKQVLGAEITRMQNELRARLEAKVSEKRRELEKLIAEKRAIVEKQIAATQAVVDEQRAQVEAKKNELTDRLEKEKTGKMDDVLKGIFKKK